MMRPVSKDESCNPRQPSLKSAACGGVYLILCPPTHPADGEAMSSAATVETFSIMSTRGRVVKCNASGFAETCTETRPEELRRRVEKLIPNVEVSRLIKRIVIRSICQSGSMFVLLWLLLKLETPNEFKQEKTANRHPSCQSLS